MHRILKNISKQFGLKGWSLDVDTGNRFYLSKFDPREKHNEDEYRIYFFLHVDGSVQVVRRVKIEKYKYKFSLDKNNKYANEAMRILGAYEHINFKTNQRFKQTA